MGNIYDEIKDFNYLQKQLDDWVSKLEEEHYKQKVNDTPDIDSIAERNYEDRQT